MNRSRQVARISHERSSNIVTDLESEEIDEEKGKPEKEIDSSRLVGLILAAVSYSSAYHNSAGPLRALMHLTVPHIFVLLHTGTLVAQNSVTETLVVVDNRGGVIDI